MVSSLFPLLIKNACVRKRGKTILGPINLELEHKGFTVVIGPNGVGKTTLLRLMHMLENPREGTVQWNINNEEAVTRQSFVFQTPVMMRRSVLENLLYPLKIRGVAKDERLQAAKHAITQIDLSDSANLNATFLSGGEKQKLAIARALTTKPEVLFLDEPTTNLDGRATREIETMLLAAQDQGTRIIMTTHDLGQARRLATDVLFLYRGLIHEQGKASTFFNSPQTTEARAFLIGDIVE